MRLKITHLKAPWPFGAVVGDVIDLPVMPAWAAGKCVRVGDYVELTTVPVEVVASDRPVFVVNPEVTDAEPQKAKGKK